MMPEGFDSQIDEEPHNLENSDLYWVVVFNNEYNTFEEVAHIIQRAIYCSQEVAEHIAWEVHNKGKSKVMIAPYSDAKRAANIIGTIGIRVMVTNTQD
ncbi:MAG: ATP-dependent Clp protease adaptor ClpS [Spirochaetota bacterium]|nr:ATP-dependent Clp protease adaptor ClpS [Spirochaetota bacterium]